MSERELSCFFVRELYPLYSEGNIDESRKTQVKVHLQKCKDCKSYFERLNLAREQITTLSQTKVSSEVIRYLKQEHHFWNEYAQKWGWDKWPSSLKWAMELSIVTLILMSTVHFFPWLRFAHYVNRMRPRPTMVAVKKDAPVEVPMPETSAPPIAAAPKVTPATAPVTAPVTARVPATPEPEAAVSPVSVAQATPKVLGPALPTEKEEEDGTETAGVEDGSKTSGFVWRGTLKVDELTDELTDRVTKTIKDLGGTKAGQVELGWHKGKQRYYHFILPEENYEKLLSVLNHDGIVQLTQERHPRTIKAGHMRIIMTVEENEEE